MKVEKKLFIPSIIILLVSIIFIVANLSVLQSSINAIYDWCIKYFGWLFIFADICCLLFSLWLIFGKYKNIRLGGANSKPAYSNIAWVGMMFTSSCGAWLVVYGFLESIYCVSQDAIVTGNSNATAYELGQMYSHFHWGPNAWAIYIPITVAIGYILYNRHGDKATVGATMDVLFTNKRLGFLSTIVDVISICGTVLSPVLSIGVGMPLLTALSKNIFNVSDNYQTILQIFILSLWVLMFGTSVYFGLSKGIKKLSNFNVILAFVFMGIFGLIVGLVRVFSSEINTIGLLLQNYIRLSSYTDPYGSGGFVRGWTFGYWAVYFVYMPMMGVFNAKISKGRTLREIAIGQFVFCSLGCWLAMATFGNFAINQQISGIVDVSSYLAINDEAGAIIALINSLPGAKIFMFVLLFLCFVFLATTMDSSALSAAEMTSKQINTESNAPRWLRMVWVVVAAIVAFIVVQIGGAKAVRSLCYVAGLPLAIISFLIMFSVIKMLKDDDH